jgi:23S rRNA (cytidine1920-2'-O)/16S rRNA (cytidine1409-2'-O)-methyltransferase
MCARRYARFVRLLDLIGAVRPDIGDAAHAIRTRSLVVDGRIVTNPASLVRADAAITVRRGRQLRGEAKLGAALDAFGVVVTGRTCLDVGASAGGFTRVLLERGATRVVALDAGFGQLRGDLRLDPRVVNLERRNVSDAARAVPSDVGIGIVTIDLSYLALAAAVRQLEGVRFAAGASLIALVKPMYELGLASPPTDEGTLRAARERAAAGIQGTGRWRVERSIASPVKGARGAREWFVLARREGRPSVPQAQKAEAASRRARRAAGPPSGPSGGGATMTRGIGSPLGEKVDVVRRIASGGSATDRDVVAQLLRPRAEDSPVERLTSREREILALMAEGRSNPAVGERLFLSPKTVTHVGSIFSKLGLTPDADEHRGVLAVLAYPKRTDR